MYVGINSGDPGLGTLENTKGCDFYYGDPPIYPYGPLGQYTEDGAPPDGPDGAAWMAKFVDVPPWKAIYAGSSTGITPWNYFGYDNPAQIDSFQLKVYGNDADGQTITLKWEPNILKQYSNNWKLVRWNGIKVPLDSVNMVTDADSTYTITNDGGTILQSFLIIKTGLIVAGPTFTAVPSPVDFGTIQVSTSSTLPVVISNAGVTNNLVIQGPPNAPTCPAGFAIAPAEMLTLPWTIAPGGSKTIHVTFTAPASPGTLSGNISFHDNVFVGNIDLVPVTGTGASNQLVISSPVPPDSLEFGHGVIGSLTLQCTLHNPGGVTSHVTSITLPPHWTINPTTATVLPDGDQIFDVTFAPSGSLWDVGNILFNGDAPTLTLKVSGCGLAQGGLLVLDGPDPIYDNSTNEDGGDTYYGGPGSGIAHPGYTDTIKLVGYVGEPFAGVTFKLISGGHTNMSQVKKAGAILADEDIWELDTRTVRGLKQADGSTIDTIQVTLFTTDPTYHSLHLTPEATTTNLLTFDYIVQNITEPSVITTFELRTILGSTSTAHDARLNKPSCVDIQTITIMNRTKWGDVNNDDQVDILDLLIVADYVTGRNVPAGTDILLADVADWTVGALDPTPGTTDPKINILDVIALENIILNGYYPTGPTYPIMKIANKNFAAITGKLSKTEASAVLTAHVQRNSIAIVLKNNMVAKGGQLDINGVTSVNGKIISLFDKAQVQLNGTTLRVVLLGMNITELSAGERIVIQIPATCGNDGVTMSNVIVGDAKDKAMLNVDGAVSYEAVEGQIPSAFALGQNYPNPFNPSTSISVSIPEVSQVRIAIYNMLGQQVRTLFVGQMDPGEKIVNWDGRDEIGRNVASGTYIYRMTAGTFVQTKKMMFLK